MSTNDLLLTTEDNPWNPHSDWESWYALDESLGYATCGLIARLSLDLDDSTNEVLESEVDDVYLRLVSLGIEGNYVLIDQKGNKTTLSKFFSDSTVGPSGV